MQGDDLLYYLARGLGAEERRRTLAAVTRSRTQQLQAALRGEPVPAVDDGGKITSRAAGLLLSRRRDEIGRLRPAYVPLTLTDDELRSAAERPWAG